MNAQPLVSVVMNCYNGEMYLRDAIDSIYAQTYTNWEIIFWDNASTDRTAEIAQSYDNKLRYFRSDETTVLGQARVNASKQVQGDYIAFLDADDLWLESKLEQQLAIFLKSDNQIGIVYGRSEIFYENKSSKRFVHKEEVVLPDGDIFYELAQENFIAFSSAIVDRDKFFKCGGFPENFLNSTDYWAFIHIAKEYPCGVVQEVCCKNRKHDYNLSAKQKVISAKEAICTIKDMLPDKRNEDALKMQYAKLAIMYIKEANLIGFFYIIIKYRCIIPFLNRLHIKIKSVLL